MIDLVVFLDLSISATIHQQLPSFSWWVAEKSETNGAGFLRLYA